MIKEVLKYFLFLNLLLFSGYSLLYAQNYGENAIGAKQDLLSLSNTDFSSNQIHQNTVSATITSGHRKDLKLEATESEIEEDRLLSLKKKLYNGQFFIPLLCALLLAHIYHSKQNLLFNKFVYQFSSFRSLFLKFEVFRI